MIALPCSGMFPDRFQFLKVAILAAGFATSSQAGFVAPAEGPVAFRRDKVPLDSDTLAVLSRQLTDMAYALAPTTAAEWRGAAQMLAVATATNPANTRARTLVDDFVKNRRRPNPDLEKLGKDRERVWEYISWLETPEAGPDGQALAACLKDVIAFSDPKDSRAEVLLAAGQLGAWKDWIPPQTYYEDAGSGDEPAPAADADAGAPAVVGLRAAAVSTTLLQLPSQPDPAAKWSQGAVTLVMTAALEKSADRPPFSLIIGTSQAPAFTNMTREITELLKSVHGNLPQGIVVNIDGPGLTAAADAGKQLNINAAVALLASSAITGQEPAATVLGTLDDKGAYNLTPGFWDQLRSLETAKGGRLILPLAAADYLTSMLAFEKAQFFLKYEVMLAKDFKQILELSAKKPPESLSVPIAQFAEIKARATPQSLGPYLTNSFVRRRLTEIVQAAPSHYSAKMLLIQGSGNRPTAVTRPVMISEIRRALEPLGEIARNVNASSGIQTNLATTYEKCRTALDGLERYGQKDERTLLSQAQELVASVRALDRANRLRSGSYDTSALTNAQMEFFRLYADCAAALKTAGEPNLLSP